MGILETLMGHITAPLKDSEKIPEDVIDLRQSMPDVEDGVVADGLNNDTMYEFLSQYNPASCERVISGGNNAWIVLGRDRPSMLTSGYGGGAATSAGSIDLVVGRVKPPNPPETNITGPNFTADAARIHISQTTDVDKNFGLAAGSIGRVDARSAIGMKADEIRLTARHSIKIITEGRGVQNSKDGKQKSTVGIDLIAGNRDDELQPIPLGETLVECLGDLVDLMDDLAAMVSANTTAIKNISQAFTRHTHGEFIGPVYVPVTPGIDPFTEAVALIARSRLFMEAIGPMYLHRVNTTTFRQNNLQISGGQWICSRNNNTN